MLAFVLLLVAQAVVSSDVSFIDSNLLQQVQNKYGKEAVNRLVAWQDVIRQGKNRSEQEMLEKTNRFFNSKIRFANDIEVWGVEDYWATPVEFLAKGAGDCEDFAIAKYFTLKAMGMPEQKLRITYVKALQYNIHHMVLTYYSNPNAEPLILDNLVDSINPASKRNDLMPIFSFNGSGLWLAKQRSQEPAAGSSSRIRLWRDLLKKMAENRL